MRFLTVTDSDIIEAIGFDVRGEVSALEVIFKSTTFNNTNVFVYRYEDVTEKEFIKLVTAESIGKMFHEMFKKTKKPFTKSARPTLTK